VIDDQKTPLPRVPGELDAEDCERELSTEFEFSRSTVTGPQARGGTEKLPPEFTESLRPTSSISIKGASH
jgi:hypothetical protein